MGYPLPELLKQEPRKSEEGVTFTSNPAAALWSVEVHFQNGMPKCKETIRALDEQQALTLMLNRYPFADAEKTKVIGRSSQLPLPSLPPTPSWNLGRMVLDRVRVPAAPVSAEMMEWQERRQARRCSVEPSDDLPTVTLGELLDLEEAEPDPAPPAETVKAPVEVRQNQAARPAPPAPPAAPPVTAEPSAQEGPVALPTVKPGEIDSRGRRVLSEQNARAAAVLHHAGQMNWCQLAAVIGVHQDHLRRTARRFYPDAPPVAAQKADRSGLPPVPRCRPPIYVPVSDLRPEDAWAPVLGWKPGHGWQAHQYGNRPVLEAAGCQWVIRLSDLPKPPQICGDK